MKPGEVSTAEPLITSYRLIDVAHRRFPPSNLHVCLLTPAADETGVLLLNAVANAGQVTDVRFGYHYAIGQEKGDQRWRTY